MGFMAAPVASGDFVTYLKYDARAGRWYTKPDGGGDLYEVQNMTAIFDLEGIRTGWFNFVEGQAPIKTFDPSLTEMAPRPNPDSKHGFEVLVHSDKNVGGLREFSSTAATVINAMNDLYDAWAAAKDANPGKLPVVKCKGVTAVKTAKSTNYAPALEIVAWADRPDDMVAPIDEPEVSAKKAAAPASKPAPAPEPVSASAGDDDVEY